MKAKHHIARWPRSHIRNIHHYMFSPLRQRKNVTAQVNFSMVEVDGGRFLMGCRENDPRREQDNPTHNVELTKSFAIATTQVTQELWSYVLGNNPSRFQDNNTRQHPVENVSWFDAIHFCNKLSQMAGLAPVYRIGINGAGAPGDDPEIEMTHNLNGFRLPTEAEWEFAARSDETTTFSGSNSASVVAWHGDDRPSGSHFGLNRTPTLVGNSNHSTHPVAQLNPNAWGIYDMSGNVWEWTWDRYGYGIVAADSHHDPTGSEYGRERVIRGGSWFSPAAYASVECRGRQNPNRRHSSLGLRLARTLNRK